VKQAAARHQLCEKTIYRWVRGGLLPAYRVGPRIRLSSDDLDRLCTAIPGPSAASDSNITDVDVAEAVESPTAEPGAA
jgi:excisionase family DNA binding protein